MAETITYNRHSNGSMFIVRGVGLYQGLVEHAQNAPEYADEELNQSMLDGLTKVRRRIDRLFIKGGLLFGDGVMKDLIPLPERVDSRLEREKVVVSTLNGFRISGLDLRSGESPSQKLSIIGPKAAELLLAEHFPRSVVMRLLVNGQMCGDFYTIKNDLEKHLKQFVIEQPSPGIRYPYTADALITRRLYELAKGVGVNGRTTIDGLREEALQNAAQQ